MGPTSFEPVCLSSAGDCVIAVALLIIAVALLPQALAAFSAAGPWLWVPCAFGIGALAVAGGAIAANEAAMAASPFMRPGHFWSAR